MAVVEQVREWEQRDNETPQAYEAFKTYLELGASRSLVKTAQMFGKSETLMAEWSKPTAHGWVRRALMYDRHQARALNEAILAGKASMRQRLSQQAMNMQLRAATRIHNMTDAEIRALTPAQTVAFLRCSSEVEMKARNIPESEIDAAERDDAPTFNINFIPSRPEGMTAVRMRTGEAGYIPSERVDEFLAEFPDAVAVR